MLRKISTTGLIALMLLFAVACGTSNALKGGAIGTAAGGAIGGLIGHKMDNTAVGVLIGAGIGGTAGALIGRRMDNQAEELQKDLDGATVQRVGEGILITFNEGVQFASNSSDIKGGDNHNLADLSTVLKKYPDTEILIEGHTDSDGTDELNQNLSTERAGTVETYLTGQGIDANRIKIIGYGESQPIAENTTAEGKSMNRRVEVAIFANKEMQKQAKKGNL